MGQQKDIKKVATRQKLKYVTSEKTGGIPAVTGEAEES